MGAPHRVLVCIDAQRWQGSGSNYSVKTLVVGSWVASIYEVLAANSAGAMAPLLEVEGKELH